MKKEVLDALAQIVVEREDGFEFIGETWSMESYNKEIETENYWINMEFSIMVTWINKDEYVFEGMYIDVFEVWDHFDTKINTKSITDEEIENSITINL